MELLNDVKTDLGDVKAKKKTARNQIKVPKIDIRIDPRIPVERNVECVANVTLASRPSCFLGLLKSIFGNLKKRIIL